MDIFVPCPQNATNKNTETGVVLETIWKEEMRTPKGNVPTNHHKRPKPQKIKT